MTILLVAGTRPNFMKVAPIHRALTARAIPVRLLHTGQHFDATMSEVFFRDLGLPTPDVQLGVGTGTHAEQTAEVLVGVERALMASPPQVVVVVGDVTSTVAAALAAAKLGVAVTHVEAGLRSRDWTMPEEINRVLTDQLSDLLLIPSHDAKPNLLAEGIAEERIVFVGNVMIDSLRWAADRPTNVLERLGVARGGYALATLHRPANVDSEAAMTATLDALEVIARGIPVIFPVHPRTRQRLAQLDMQSRVDRIGNLQVVEPLGYDDFVTLMSRARLVATDSGGIQEETTALSVPCLTLRGGTERPITVTEGTNTVVGLDCAKIDQHVREILAGRAKRGQIPAGWDGHAGPRIAEALERFLGGAPPRRTAGPRS